MHTTLKLTMNLMVVFLGALAFFLPVISTSISTRLTLGGHGNEVLLRNLSNLHYQLFSTIQHNTDAIESAYFETYCTKKGCEFTKNQYGTDVANDTEGYIEDICQRLKPRKCKKGWKHYKGHCYTQPSVRLNWYNAQMFCRNKNAHLARVDDKCENGWLAHAFPQKNLYIDFTDLGDEGVWKSFTFGELATYTNWTRGNPSNSYSREHCAEINRDHVGLWNDVPCDFKLKFVCESFGIMD